MNRNISEQDKRVSSHLAIYNILEYWKNSCICEYGRICHAVRSWKNPKSPEEVVGSSRTGPAGGSDGQTGDVLGGTGRLSQTWHLQLPMCRVVISYHLVMLWKARIGRVMPEGQRRSRSEYAGSGKRPVAETPDGSIPVSQPGTGFFYWNNCAWVVYVYTLANCPGVVLPP